MQSTAVRPHRHLVPRQVLASYRPARRISCYASSVAPEFTGRQFTLLSTSVDATEKLAAMLAEDMKIGDAYCLKGDEGAGKTAFR
jgi:hypothetical protein